MTGTLRRRASGRSRPQAAHPIPEVSHSQYSASQCLGNRICRLRRLRPGHAPGFRSVVLAARVQSIPRDSRDAPEPSDSRGALHPPHGADMRPFGPLAASRSAAQRCSASSSKSSDLNGTAIAAPNCPSARPDENTIVYVFPRFMARSPYRIGALTRCCASRSSRSLRQTDLGPESSQYSDPMMSTPICTSFATRFDGPASKL